MTENRWVHPKKELPNEYDSVLVYDGVSIFIAHLEYDPDPSWFRDIDDTPLDIIYWMPFPALPKE